jgi:putative mRNA 3-end processing factor
MAKVCSLDFAPSLRRHGARRSQRSVLADIKMDLIIARSEGLYCPLGDFYIDPWRPVARAVITHGHADHARPGSAAYLCHRDSVAILQRRLGAVNVEGVAYGESLDWSGVKLSLHPAGHILGSAQVRVAFRGEVWVASGDYKLEADGTCAPFEPIRCDAFITESTFGLPLYRWRPQADIFGDINRWWRANAQECRASVVQAYSLGKAQRILKNLDGEIGPIVCHGALEPINEIYRRLGVALPRRFSAHDGLDKKQLSRSLVLAPPAAARSPWIRRFGAHSDAFASGWMQIRGNRRRRGVDQGFALSDHADWFGLLQAIGATGASRVFVTHGGVAPLVRYLHEKGIDAQALAAEYGDETLEEESGSNGPSAAPALSGAP